MKKDLLKLLDELRAIAQLGIHYTKDDFDRGRYEKILQLTANTYADIADLHSPLILKRFQEELGHITPKAGVNGAIIFEDTKLFITRRADDGLWEMPGGWCDLGESPRDALRRELLEETSLAVEIGELIEVFHRLPGDFDQPHTTYHLLFVARVKTGEFAPSSETTDYKLFDGTEKLSWHRDHEKMASTALTWLRLQRPAR